MPTLNEILYTIQTNIPDPIIKSKRKITKNATTVGEVHYFHAHKTPTIEGYSITISSKNDVIKFKIYNPEELELERLERITKMLNEFLLRTDRLPYEIEVTIIHNNLPLQKTGIIYKEKFEGIQVSIISDGRPVKVFSASMNYTWDMLPKYCLAVSKNKRAFGITRITKEAIRRVGINPDTIFNDFGDIVNQELYMEAVKKILKDTHYELLTKLGQLFTHLIAKYKVFIIDGEDAKNLCIIIPDCIKSKCLESVQSFYSHYIKSADSTMNSIHFHKRVMCINPHWYTKCVKKDRQGNCIKEIKLFEDGFAVRTE